MKKIAIVGPESSGKSFLTEALAKKYNAPFVQEYAREYLLSKNGQYTEEDLLEIALGQLSLENKGISKAKEFLFCDTTLLVIIIWAEYKYGRVDSKIIEAYKPDDYALHLLLKPDIQYSEDPLRENPSLKEREEIFNLYHQKLIDSKSRFEIISGEGNERLNNAIKALNYYFN